MKVSDQQPRWSTDEYLDLRRQSQKAHAIAQKTNLPADGDTQKS